MTSISIPFNVVNYICELAAGDDKIWYPFFSPKTGKVSWKINPYCVKYIHSSMKFLNKIREINLTFYNVKTNEEREIKCKIVIFNQSDLYIKKLYIEFDSDDDNSGKFMLRGMINVFDHYIKCNDSLYLKGTEYATTTSGWAPNIWNKDSTRMTIEYETY